jgi:predicted RND superfamily exporter protein
MAIKMAYSKTMEKEKVTTINQLIAKITKDLNQATISKNNAIDAFLTSNKRQDRDNVLKRRAEERILKEVQGHVAQVIINLPNMVV